jgi:putative transposase
MIKSVKFRIFPTKEQEILMRKSVGITRFAYNWGLAKQEENFKNGGKFIPCRKLRDEFVALKKEEEYKWLKEVSSNAIKQAFDDLDTAYKNFFAKRSGKPNFKSKKKSKHSFYVRYDALKIKENTINLEKIGRVKFKTNKEIPILDKYMNPRASFDGKYWYLSFGFEHQEQGFELNDFSVGIDLGIKDLAIASNIEKPIKNINKTKAVRKLKKKLRRLQRQVSRKYEMNKQGEKFIKTKNISKLEMKIKLVHRKLNNTRLNHIHQATAMIVKTKPSRVVMEHLNIKGMMKNKHLSKAIQEQKWFEFKQQMEYKCKFYGIEFLVVDRWFPSSKMCSCCGNVKKTLKVSERTYRCEECGLVEDRDKNASYNLANFELINTQLKRVD